MASGNQMYGMLGVYLAAAELTSRGFIVSPTSRSAFGADLLVTDQKCHHAWSVQVKTKSTNARYWLLSAAAGELRSKSHIYILVHLNGNNRPDYLVVSSTIVAGLMTEKVFGKDTWRAINRDKVKSAIEHKHWVEGWEVFGKPTVITKPLPPARKNVHKRAAKTSVTRKA